MEEKESKPLLRIDMLYVVIAQNRDGHRSFHTYRDKYYPSAHFFSHCRQEEAYDWFHFQYRDEILPFDHARDFSLGDMVLEVEFNTLDINGNISRVISSLYNREYFSVDGDLSDYVKNNEIEKLAQVFESTRVSNPDDIEILDLPL